MHLIIYAFNKNRLRFMQVKFEINNRLSFRLVCATDYFVLIDTKKYYFISININFALINYGKII